jgi:hypothetical protein
VHDVIDYSLFDEDYDCLSEKEEKKKSKAVLTNIIGVVKSVRKLTKPSQPISGSQTVKNVPLKVETEEVTLSESKDPLEDNDLCFIVARPTLVMPTLKSVDEDYSLLRKAFKVESTRQPEVLNIVENEHFCLPLPQKDMGLNPFDKSLRLNQHAKFTDFNSH